MEISGDRDGALTLTLTRGNHRPNDDLHRGNISHTKIKYHAPPNARARATKCRLTALCARSRTPRSNVRTTQGVGRGNARNVA